MRGVSKGGVWGRGAHQHNMPLHPARDCFEPMTSHVTVTYSSWSIYADLPELPLSIADLPLTIAFKLRSLDVIVTCIELNVDGRPLWILSLPWEVQFFQNSVAGVWKCISGSRGETQQ